MAKSWRRIKEARGSRSVVEYRAVGITNGDAVSLLKANRGEDDEDDEENGLIV